MTINDLGVGNQMNTTFIMKILLYYYFIVRIFFNDFEPPLKFEMMRNIVSLCNLFIVFFLKNKELLSVMQLPN